MKFKKILRKIAIIFLYFLHKICLCYSELYVAEFMGTYNENS